MRNFSVFLCAVFVILPLVSSSNGRFNYGKRKSHDPFTSDSRQAKKRVNKPNACPNAESPFESCEMGCTGDYDCKDELKCCSHNVCGTQCMEPVKETVCNIPCPRNMDPVCGSDGVTYSNECMLRFTTCTRNQNFIMMKGDGKCLIDRPCDEELKKYSSPMIGQKIPQCDVDGYYKPMQCWGSVGRCWCTTRQGDLIETPEETLISSEEDCLEFLPESE